MLHITGKSFPIFLLQFIDSVDSVSYFFISAVFLLRCLISVSYAGFFLLFGQSFDIFCEPWFVISSAIRVHLSCADRFRGAIDYVVSYFLPSLLYVVLFLYTVSMYFFCKFVLKSIFVDSISRDSILILDLDATVFFFINCMRVFSKDQTMLCGGVGKCKRSYIQYLTWMYPFVCYYVVDLCSLELEKVYLYCHLCW